VINVIAVLETFAAFVIAIVIHECGHAGMAKVLGDSSPASAGRLSLNPARHLAPIGTVVAVVLAFLPIPAAIGWGKPVRVDALRMRVGPNLGMILVALAGPAFNFLIGAALAISITFIPGYYGLTSRLADVVNSATGPCSRVLSPQRLQECLATFQPGYLLRIEQFLIILAIANIVIAFINVIPLHPLDGYDVLFALLPNDQAVAFRRWEPSMEAIVLVLFFVIPVLFRFLGLSVEPASFFNELARGVVTKIAGDATILAFAL
jgi:Zn-dependent protease